MEFTSVPKWPGLTSSDIDLTTFAETPKKISVRVSRGARGGAEAAEEF